MEWSAIPDVNATVDYLLASLPAPESPYASTPGWLTPPSPTFPPSETPTATISFDTPKPGQVQGVRGTVLAAPCPIEPGAESVPTAGPQFGVRIVIVDSVTGQAIAQTKTGSYGSYTVCAIPDDRQICTSDVIVTAGKFTIVDLGYGLL